MSFESNITEKVIKPTKSAPKVSDESLKQTPTTPVSPFTPFVKVKLETLPSRGIPYPEDSTVSYRPYVYGEVKRISQEKGSDDYLEFALEGMKTSFPIEDLTLGDALYLGLLRKISTLGATKYTIPWKCPKCGHRNTYIFNTQDLEFKDMSDEVEVLPIEVDFTLADGTEKTVLMSPVTVGDYIKLKKINKIDNEVYYMAAQIRDMPLEEAIKFLDALPVTEGVTIEAVDELLYHEVKQLTLVCSNSVGTIKCGHTVPYEIDRGESLLIPFRESEVPVRNKIRSSKTSPSKHK